MQRKGGKSIIKSFVWRNKYWSVSSQLTYLGSSLTTKNCRHKEGYQKDDFSIDIFNKCSLEESGGGTVIFNPSAITTAIGFTLISADRWAATLKSHPFFSVKSLAIHSMLEGK